MNLSQRTDLERRCLSCIMIDAENVTASVAEGLKADHFGDLECREMFIGCVASANKDPKMPPSESLMMAAYTAGIGVAKVAEIVSLESTSYKRAGLVQSVMSMAKSSRAFTLLSEAIADAKGADATNWATVWEAVGPKLTLISELTADRRMVQFKDLCDAYIQTQKNPQTVKTISTGMRHWDIDATPVKAHEMIAMAGRPGTGKTALAMQMARSVAKTGTVAVFSLEMEGVELVSRLATHEAGRDGVGTHPAEIRARIEAIEAIRDIKTIKVFDDPYMTVEEIEARCRLLQAGPDGLAFVVIDYLQLIEVSADMKRAPREQQVAQMSRRLKLMPKRIGCPVLVLCQLNRDCENEGRPPRKSDLRESGAIEQDADRIWLLYSPIENGVVDETSIVLLQDKCRAGPAFIATRLYFDRPCFRFTPMTSASRT